MSHPFLNAMPPSSLGRSLPVNFPRCHPQDSSLRLPRTTSFVVQSTLAKRREDEGALGYPCASHSVPRVDCIAFKTSRIQLGVADLRPVLVLAVGQPKRLVLISLSRPSRPVMAFTSPAIPFLPLPRLSFHEDGFLSFSRSLLAIRGRHEIRARRETFASMVFRCWRHSSPSQGAMWGGGYLGSGRAEGRALS